MTLVNVFLVLGSAVLFTLFGIGIGELLEQGRQRLNLSNEKMRCPLCHSRLPVESMRTHTNGRRRTYWECLTCRLSIMRRPA